MRWESLNEQPHNTAGHPIVNTEMEEHHSLDQLNRFYGVEGFVRRRIGQTGAGIEDENFENDEDEGDNEGREVTEEARGG